MTSILSWNIQNGKGVDGRVSLERIAGVIREMADPDVICLQEVSRGLDLGAHAGAPDQVEQLARLFPGYVTAFGAGVDALDPARNQRWQFGNLLLSRHPLLCVLHHPLPRPADGGRLHMHRAATEVVVATRGGPVRVVNLHLEFHSMGQRWAQVERLRDLQREALGESAHPPLSPPNGPYRQVSRCVEAVYCGDFNMTCESPEYRRLLEPLDDVPRPFVDAWRVAHPARDHAPTCGVHDPVQWPEGPHCRDFFFVSGGCVAYIENVRVDTGTDASDHQPLLIELSM